MSIPLIAGLGPQELIIIAVVLVLLFGAKKLPELARGSGQALRIFKAETKALSEDDDKKTPEQRNIDARNESTTYEAPPPKPTANPRDQGDPEHRTDTPG
jgi:sec-independent protein translocase protein TatA